jgi:hypothetical protein
MSEPTVNLTGSRFEEILIRLETQLLAELPKARAATNHGGKQNPATSNTPDPRS